ncbi:MAG: hypothetical protein AB7U72_13545, partial [Methanosarcina sp.]
FYHVSFYPVSFYPVSFYRTDDPVFCSGTGLFRLTEEQKYKLSRSGLILKTPFSSSVKNRFYKISPKSFCFFINSANIFRQLAISD